MTRRHRAIWVSDVHLGTRACKAEFLLDFLRHNECDTLYLVGDIVDGWALRKVWHWPQAHNDVVQKVLRKARKGSKVVYVAGNHDEAVRHFLGLNFGGVEICDETVHITADGRRLLVVHGDRYDAVVGRARWLAKLGSSAYHLALDLNDVLNAVRRRLGYPYWSLSQMLKHRVKKAVSFIADYEAALVREARERGFDGVVCGHIHKAEIREMDGVLYLNDGDWVESCTALVETLDGRLELVTWQKVTPPEPALAAA
mgnify:CR=1 FL=1